MYQALIPRGAGRVTMCVLFLFLAAFLSGCGQKAGLSEPAAANTALDADTTAPAAPDDSLPEAAPLQPIAAEKVVEQKSCDGENTVNVPENLSGQPLADALMDQWKLDHPDRDWVAEEKRAHAFHPPADNSDILQGDQGKSHAYGNYTKRDILIWARETEKFVAAGSRIFHSADELGSSVNVSCDMCHPHASNTHPETYPKFQTQLGRVVLLRDMIDWCVENPVRGEHMELDGFRMRALEAYIMAQRKGVEMNYGKH